jgi:NhaA family Na+:H+ antiporter
MMKHLRFLNAFLESEKSGGLLLLACAFGSIIISNSLLSESYQHIWHISILSKPIEFWINDGLMTIFFLQVGLEIEREIYIGELNDFKKSLLPIIAASGGMVVPAAIHFVLNKGLPSQNGYGIPMATDIAFSLGILSLLGNRVPFSFKVFLTALAIIDDLGAILIIALFYSSHLSVLYLGLAALIFIVMIILNRMNVLALWIYLLLGCVLWFCMHRSGIHATITGVLLAFAIPFRSGDAQALSTRLQHRLHWPVTFIILPLFALANTALIIPSTFAGDLISHNSLGIILGLLVGKPFGIFLFAVIGSWFGWCTLPANSRLPHLFAIGLLAGIGFTMSIFITLLAFNDAVLIDSSKIAVMAGSLFSGLAGFIILRLLLNKSNI